MARELQALAQSMVPKAGKDMECPSDRGLERAEVRAREPWGPGRGSRVSFREKECLDGSEQDYDMVCFPMIFLDCQGRWQGET